MASNDIFEGQVHLYKLLFAFYDSLCLKWCVDQSIPNIIRNHGQPMTLHELASTLKVPQAKVSGVHRLMRYLAHIGLFDTVRIQKEDEEEKEAYALTFVSKLLIRGSDHCLSPMVDLILDPTMSSSHQQLGKWVHDHGDQTPFALALGTENLSGSNNLSYIGGDMFQSVPKADAVLLKKGIGRNSYKYKLKYQNQGWNLHFQEYSLYNPHIHQATF
ncbi:hypothetical protein PIB30_022238 [Stylosanthes scabra]|uniref:O-methyltransferase dimerisation domain-containing protein n=1 Tax=Stylosanthes scabra TaxID=79078 RepID=A0ABU6QA60_9FABA|nr:hypothetical protein [Stylosanthes scabra]